MTCLRLRGPPGDVLSGTVPAHQKPILKQIFEGIVTLQLEEARTQLSIKSAASGVASTNTPKATILSLLKKHMSSTNSQLVASGLCKKRDAYMKGRLTFP